MKNDKWYNLSNYEKQRIKSIFDFTKFLQNNQKVKIHRIHNVEMMGILSHTFLAKIS